MRTKNEGLCGFEKRTKKGRFMRVLALHLAEAPSKAARAKLNDQRLMSSHAEAIGIALNRGRGAHPGTSWSVLCELLKARRSKRDVSNKEVITISSHLSAVDIISTEDNGGGIGR